jgi:hypothetical protein
MDPDSDPDYDPDIFVIGLQDANTKIILKKFFCLLLFEGPFISCFKDKKYKKTSQNRRNQGFSYHFSMMLEGTGSGSIPLTNSPDPDPEGQKHTDPTDPDSDPQH